MPLVDYISIFLVCAALCLSCGWDVCTLRFRKLAFLLIGIWMVILALRLEGMDRSIYLAMYDGMDTDIEPSYQMLANFVVGRWNDPIYIFCIYALIGVSIKLFVIERMRRLAYAALLVYASQYFLLHEMIQIRAGVASGLFLMAMMIPRERTVVYYLKVLALAAVATFFHYSGILILVLLCFGTEKINKKFWIGLMGVSFVALCCRYTIARLLVYIPIDFIQTGLNRYLDAMSVGKEMQLNPFSKVHLLKVAIVCFLILKCDNFSKINKNALLILKIYVMGISCFWLLSDIPAAAARVSEMLCVSEIILFPLILLTWRGVCGKLIFFIQVLINFAVYSLRLCLSWENAL